MRHLAQPGVAVAGEQRCASLPERDVRVHAGAVVAEQRLGHEGDDLVVLLGDVLDDVLVDHHLVGHPHELAGTSCRFRTARRWPLRGAGLRRRCRSRSAFASSRCGCSSAHRPAARGSSLPCSGACSRGSAFRRGRGSIPLRRYRCGSSLRADSESNRTSSKMKNSSLGADEARVGDAGALQVVDRLAGDVARVAAVIFAGDRVLDVADHHQRRQGGERVDEGRFRLRARRACRSR